MGLADSNQSPIESYNPNDNQLESKLTTLLKVDADFHYKRAIEYKESNLAKYKEHLFIAANQGHIVASYELAWELDRVQISSSEFMHSYELTAFYYTFAAEHGHHLAQFRTGYCFEHGLGVPKSLEKAAYYYSLAANAGIFYGYALLGQCYELGRGVEQSLEKAKQNYAHLVNTEWLNPEVIYDIAEKYLFRANKYNLATTPSYDSDFLREKSFRLFQLVFLYYRAKDLVLGDLGAHFQVIDFYEKNLGIVENDSSATAYKDLNNSIRLHLLNLDLEKNTLKHQKLRVFLDLQALANDSDENDNKTNAEYALATNYAQGIGLELQPSPTLFQYYIFKAAREHHVDALFEIGKSYDWGENDFPYAPRKAAEYYLKAADLGHPAAQFAIGNFFEKGIVVDQSHSKTLEYYKNAALQENKGALGMLGLLMEFESNISEATKYYQKCANCNWSENELLKDIEQARKMPSQSSHRLNRCYQEAFIYYRIKAESSDADAQCKVADFLRLGWFKLHNEELALPVSKKYYELAALQDHPKAQCWLGYILERENDFENAFKYYEKASKQGNACAMGLLGMCYEEGKGTSENLAKAHECYKLSDKGLWKNEQFFDSSFHFGHVERFIYSYLREATESAETKAILADCYETGDGVIASAELSSYYRLLAENVSKGWHTSLIKEANDGNANSQYILSFLYDKGDFIPPSQELRNKYLLLAVNQGEDQAVTELFNIFENDFDSLGISFAQCLSYMLAAGSHNDRTACWFLGFCYEYGLGVEVDLELSITYYKACLKEDSYWEKDFDLFAYWNYFNLCERINGETNVEIYNIYKEGLIVCEYGEDEAIQDVNDGKKFIQIAHTELSTSKATHSLFRGLYVFRRVFLFFFAQAAAGEVDAITRLGECYMNGIGVEKSEEKAHYYSQMALEQKNMLFHDN